MVGGMNVSIDKRWEVSPPLSELQSPGMDGKHARLAGIAIILLRSVIVAACIMFGLHKLAIRPGFTTSHTCGGTLDRRLDGGRPADLRTVNTVASVLTWG